MKHVMPIGLLTCCLANVGLPGGTPIAVRAEAQDEAAIARQLVGTWRLVSWAQRSADGTSTPGPVNAGYIIYTDVGRMCAVLMDSTRPRWPQGPPQTVEQATERSAGFISYCSAVEVHAKDGFVLHHVDVERSPNIVGTIRKRWFTFDGPNRLTLRIDQSELGSGVLDSRLNWERVQK